MESGLIYKPINDVLDFNGNKILQIKTLCKDVEIEGNVKVLVYPEQGFCSVDSLKESEIKTNFVKSN